ncbi:glutamate receptor ionotropic, NMDA 1 [Nematostella vectensis]|nr:glutamate receptor ionotropic, NMDA 1 [Nematostella vectensis]
MHFKLAGSVTKTCNNNNTVDTLKAGDMGLRKSFRFHLIDSHLWQVAMVFSGVVLHVSNSSSLKVGLLLDKSAPAELETEFVSILNFVNGNSSLHPSVVLEAVVFRWDPRQPPGICFSRLRSEFLEKNMSAIVSLLAEEKDRQLLVSLVEDYTVPVLGLANVEPVLPKTKKVGGNLQLSLLPSEALYATVIRDLLLEYEESHFSCFTTKQAKQDPFWFYLFQHVTDSKANSSAGFPRCILLEEGRMIEQIYEAILAIRANGVKILIVHVFPQNSESMLNITQRLSLHNFNDDFTWIFTESAMITDPGGLPNRAIGISRAFRKNAHNQMEDPLVTLRRDVMVDATQVLINALSSSLRGVPRERLISWCEEGMPAGSRMELYRKMTSVNLKGRTGPLEFSSTGARLVYQFAIAQVTELQAGVKHWEKKGVAHAHSTTILQPRVFEAFLKQDLPHPRRLRIVTIEHHPFTMLRSPDFSNKMGTKCSSENSVLCLRYSKNKPSGQGLNESHFEEFQEVMCCYGVMIDLLLLIQKQSGFTFELYLVRDGRYGSYDPELREMNGMIGDVARGTADMALATITITQERLRYVDFTTPYAGNSLTFLVKKQRKSTKSPFPEWIQDTRLMKPFSVDLWLTCVATFLFVAFTVWLIEKLTKYKKIRSGLFLPFEYLAYVYGNIFHVPLTHIQAKTHAVPVIMVVTNFGALVLVSSYTANLLVSLIVVDDVTVVKGLDDNKLINPPDDFKFATIRDTSSEDFFKNSPNRRLRDIYESMKDESVGNFSEGVARVRSGDLTAFIAESDGLLYDITDDPDCSLKRDGKPLDLAGLALALMKNSAWTSEISSAIHKINAKDLIAKIVRRWVVVGCQKGGNPVVAYRMSLAEFGGFVFNTALCALGCFFIMAIEIVFYRRITKTRQRFQIPKSESAATIMTSMSVENILRHNLESTLARELHQRTNGVQVDSILEDNEP